MNPTAIVDREIEAIVLVFIAIPANLDQWDMIKEGRVQQQVMVTRVRLSNPWNKIEMLRSREPVAISHCVLDSIIVWYNDVLDHKLPLKFG